MSKQLRIWKHNSFFGHAKIMAMQARAIIDADSTNQSTKDIAQNIYVLADKLSVALKDRV